MHNLDSLIDNNPHFFIDREDAQKLAEALRQKGYDLPLIAVHCIYEVWSEETHCAGWSNIYNYDHSADALILWIKTRQA